MSCSLPKPMPHSDRFVRPPSVNPWPTGRLAVTAQVLAGILLVTVPLASTPAAPPAGSSDRVAEVEPHDGSKEAIDRGLHWLAKSQNADGSWSFDPQQGCAVDRCAATALVILPFLSTGNTRGNDPLNAHIERGISFLSAASVRGDGRCYEQGKGTLFSQGLASLALSKCYRNTQDPQMERPAQLALNFIMDAQDPRGGWAKAPGQPPDVATTAWQFLALEAGHNASLSVRWPVIKKVFEFLDSVESEEGGFYGSSQPGKEATPTAAGLACRMRKNRILIGENRSAILRGARFLAEQGPSDDLVHDFFATNVMCRLGGKFRARWTAEMRRFLLGAQVATGPDAGSWYDGCAGNDAVKAAGRVCSTALALMILETPDRRAYTERDQMVQMEDIYAGADGPPERAGRAIVSVRHAEGSSGAHLDVFVLEEDGSFRRMSIFSRRTTGMKTIAGMMPKDESRQLLQAVSTARDQDYVADDAGHVQFKWVDDNGEEQVKDYSDPKADSCQHLLKMIDGLVAKYGRPSGEPSDAADSR